MQRFVSLIISRFQNINPEKEGKTVNRPADVKSELRMITMEDDHFSMWKEFIERHHRGELINPDSREMFKEKKPFILSSKFQLTREFFKHFGHFTDDDFKVYVQHLLGRTLGRMSAYPKVTVHKTNHVHASHHIGHEWVERRKRKRVILEELVELQPDLKFFAPDGAVDGDVWRQWKRDHRVSSATYNILLHLPGSQYFAKRLTNEGKLKRASEFQEKFPDMLLFLRNFFRLKLNLASSAGHIRLQAQDRVSLALSRDWNYDDQPQLGLGVMDLWMAPTNSDGDDNSRDPAFFTYIQRMRRISSPNFSEASVWLWIHESDVRARQSTDFVKRFMPEYESTYSVYRASRNERLNDAKTRAPLAGVYLLFLLRCGDDHASHLRQNVKAEFAVPSDVPYYSEVGRYNEVK